MAIRVQLRHGMSVALAAPTLQHDERGATGAEAHNGAVLYNDPLRARLQPVLQGKSAGCSQAARSTLIGCWKELAVFHADSPLSADLAKVCSKTRLSGALLLLQQLPYLYCNTLLMPLKEKHCMHEVLCL
jgi:hypothetical protein